jgi:tryptophan-rich sensory protein
MLFKPGTWYANLDKPWWTPPNWMFPVVWAALYLSMSVAAARVATLPDAPVLLALWAVQISFNTLWSGVFFGLKALWGGFLVLSGLWLAVLVTTVAFLQADLLAGLLFAPYLAWVCVALALNFSVWRRNGQRA